MDEVPTLDDDIDERPNQFYAYEKLNRSISSIAQGAGHPMLRVVLSQMRTFSLQSVKLGTDALLMKAAPMFYKIQSGLNIMVRSTILKMQQSIKNILQTIWQVSSAILIAWTVLKRHAMIKVNDRAPILFKIWGMQRIAQAPPYKKLVGNIYFYFHLKLQFI